MERRTGQRKREPSRLALELADAFAPCSQWSEVRVERGAQGRRTRVVEAPTGGIRADGPAPFDWATGAL
jgi:hypothetical protein